MDDLRSRLDAAVGRWTGGRLSPTDQADIVDELAQHLEQEFEELRARAGVQAARERMLAQLNDPALLEAVVRPRHRVAPGLEPRGGLRGLRGVGRDVRYAARTLRRSPALVATAVLALALGIGLTTVMYSIIYGALIRGLPYEDAGRIAQVMVAQRSLYEDYAPLSVHDFADYRAQQSAFETLGAYTISTATVSGDGEGAAEHV